MTPEIPPAPRKGRQLYIATNNGDISGGEVMLFAIARAVRAEGWTVSVIAPRTPDEVCRRADAEGFEVIRLAADSRPAYILQLARWAARHRRAWIWCNGLVPCFALIGHRRRVNHLHQVPEGTNRLFARLIRTGGRRSLVPSDFGARAAPATVSFHNWTEQITPDPDVSAADFGVRIGFLGRMAPVKGLPELARAAAQLRREEDPRLNNLRLVVAGDFGHISAPDQHEVEQALAELPEQTLDRCGHIRPAELFAQIDLLVVPSRMPEIFGLTAAEAMSAGVPLVVSDDGALPEIVGSDYPWIARKGDAEDLARVLRRAVVTVTEDPEETRRITERARKRWEALFSPSAGQTRVATILRRIESGATPVAPLTKEPHGC